MQSREESPSRKGYDRHRLTLDRRQLKHDLARVWGSFMDSSKVAGKPDASMITRPLLDTSVSATL
jgi:hypothetical protein